MDRFNLSSFTDGAALAAKEYLQVCVRGERCGGRGDMDATPLDSWPCLFMRHCR
jgi:hypothetical protein